MKTFSPLSFTKRNAYLLMSISLMLSDFLSILLAGFFGLAVRSILVGEKFHVILYKPVFPIALFCLTAYALRGIYPGIGIGKVDELRRLILTTSVVIFGLAGLTFFARNPELYSRLTIGFTWLLSLVFVPLFRNLTRAFLSKFSFWGIPIAVIGSGAQSRVFVQYLLDEAAIGLDPTVILDGFANHEFQYADVPVMSAEKVLSNGDWILKNKIETAVLLSSEVPKTLIEKISRRNKGGFRRLIVIPDLEGFSSLGLELLDLNGIIGFELRNNLLDPWAQIIKRAMDLVLVLIGGVLFLPFLLLITLIIPLNSKGSPLYGHVRIGKNGKKYIIWKFRTMVANADKILDDYLAKNPKLRVEWEDEQKLKNDPRITKLGGFFRKYSLDELPQLWNVLMGDMSLVGPRPIVDDEARKYADGFDFYKQVKPGITGMWQVNGRTDTTYEERVRLDEYYVRNWSIWLDIHILAKTFWVVLKRDGAY